MIPMSAPTAAQRRRIYQVATAVIPLLVAYGLLSSEQAPLWLALAAALLGATAPALAVKNTPKDDGA